MCLQITTANRSKTRCLTPACLKRKCRLQLVPLVLRQIKDHQVPFKDMEDAMDRLAPKKVGLVLFWHDDIPQRKKHPVKAGLKYRYCSFFTDNQSHIDTLWDMNRIWIHNCCLQLHTGNMEPANSKHWTLKLVGCIPGSACQKVHEHGTCGFVWLHSLIGFLPHRIRSQTRHRKMQEDPIWFSYSTKASKKSNVFNR